MRNYLAIFAVAGLIFGAAPAFAGTSGNSGEHGTTGDLNAPPSGSPSDISNSTQVHNELARTGTVATATPGVVCTAGMTGCPPTRETTERPAAK